MLNTLTDTWEAASKLIFKLVVGLKGLGYALLTENVVGKLISIYPSLDAATTVSMVKLPSVTNN